MNDNEIAMRNKTILSLPVYNINSREELDALVRKLDDSWIFRGQENANWNLLSSYDRARKDLGTVEGFSSDEFQPQLYIREFNGIQNAKKLFHKPELSNIEMLAYLQHYGTSTRLLDFTFSFYIAFAFAFENPVRKSKAIWAVNLKKLMQPHLDRERAEEIQKIMKQPQKKPEQDYNIGFDAEEHANAHWEYRREYNHSHRECFQKKINTFITNLPEKDGEEIPLGILPYFADGNNPRIKAQNGLFLFPTKLESTFLDNCQASLQVDLLKNSEQSDNSAIINSAIIKIVFNELFFSTAQQILHTMNLAPHTLYPDEIGLAKSIHLI